MTLCVFSLRMAVLLHKWEFKNIEVEFLKVSEKEPKLSPRLSAKNVWLSANNKWTLCILQVELADRKDQSIPPGWAVDETGKVILFK